MSRPDGTANVDFKEHREATVPVNLRLVRRWPGLMPTIGNPPCRTRKQEQSLGVVQVNVEWRLEQSSLTRRKEGILRDCLLVLALLVF